LAKIPVPTRYCKNAADTSFSFSTLIFCNAMVASVVSMPGGGRDLTRQYN
jgi:hypothetical protein